MRLFERKLWFIYYFDLVLRMGLAESLSLYHQAPNLVQIRKSEIHKVNMNFKILKNYISIEKGIRVFPFLSHF